MTCLGIKKCRCDSAIHSRGNCGRYHSAGLPTPAPLPSRLPHIRGGCRLQATALAARVQRRLPAFRCPAPEPTRPDERQAHMGEAIARFRELALASRCRSDAAFIQPSHILLPWLPPWKTLAIERQLLAGKMRPREFASLLRLAARHDSSRRGEPDFSLSQKDRRDLSLSLGGAVREATLANSPAVRDLARQHAAALRESSVCEDRLLASVEKRLAALSESTLAMREMAADFWMARYSQTKAEYAKQLVRWQRAYDALAVYVDELPKAAGSIPRRKTPRSRKGIGGRRDKWSKALKRQILADHEKYLRQMKQRRKKPLSQRLWVVTEWATADDREMKRNDALALWNAAKREKQRRQTQ